MTNKVIAKRTQPVCYMPDGRFLCYHNGHIFVMRGGKKVKVIDVPISKKERYLGWSRLLSRLLRFGIRAAEVLDNNNVILSIGNMVYELNIEIVSVSKGWF